MNFPTPDSELIFLVCGVQMYTLFLNTQLLLKQNKQSFLHQHSTPLFTGFYNSEIILHHCFLIIDAIPNHY